MTGGKTRSMKLRKSLPASSIHTYAPICSATNACISVMRHTKLTSFCSIASLIHGIALLLALAACVANNKLTVPCQFAEISVPTPALVDLLLMVWVCIEADKVLVWIGPTRLCKYSGAWWIYIASFGAWWLCNIFCVLYTTIFVCHMHRNTIQV